MHACVTTLYGTFTQHATNDHTLAPHLQVSTKVASTKTLTTTLMTMNNKLCVKLGGDRTENQKPKGRKFYASEARGTCATVKQSRSSARLALVGKGRSPPITVLPCTSAD